MTKREDIKVEYDGKYPNLCSGHLIIHVNEITYDFGYYKLTSGGGVYHNGHYQDWTTKHGPWSIDDWPEDFPDDDGLKLLVLDVINNEIKWGCCSGCI